MRRLLVGLPPQRRVPRVSPAELLYRPVGRGAKAGLAVRSCKGYRRRAGVLTASQAVAFGGNFLLNIGPASDGTIPAVFADRLLAIGAWLNVSGGTLYSARLTLYSLLARWRPQAN